MLVEMSEERIHIMQTSEERTMHTRLLLLLLIALSGLPVARLLLPIPRKCKISS